jgi:hypothetical protein
VKLCDSSYLIAFLHPNPAPPKDRQDKPVTRFKERIEALIADLSAANDVIGIPTPALAETLVRSGPNRAQYMKILGDSYKFQLVSFDARAAIEAAELIAAVKTKKQPWETWAKVKFDIQIVAMAKVEGASVIYSDDRDIENYAKRFNIRVIRICDLALPPPPEEPKPIDSSPVGSQIGMFPPPPPAIPFPEVKPDEAISPPVVRGSVAQPSNELEAAPVQGSDSGSAQDEAAAEATETRKEENLR